MHDGARRVDPEEETPSITPRTEALLRQAIELFGEYAELSQRPMQDIMLHLLSEKDPGSAADMTAQAASYDYKEKMRVLSQLAPVRRLETANRLLARELEVLRLEAQLQEKTQQSIDKGQRDYYLREQLKVIRGELGENDEDAEIDEYREKIEKLHLPQEADEKLHKELQRLEKQPYGSAEASVIRNYLDVALELPWNTRTRERTDIRIARRILDEDHFGLEKVKERILEILAVRQLAPGAAGGRSSASSPSGRRQDVHRHERGPRSEPEACPHLARRRARRGRDPRPSQDLYRRDARPHPDCHAAGRNAQSAPAAR